MQEEICWRLVPPTMLFTLAPTVWVLVVHAVLLQIFQLLAQAAIEKCRRRYQTRGRSLALVKAYLHGGGTVRQLAKERDLTEEQLLLLLLE